MPHDTNSVVASDATSTDIASSPSPILTAPSIGEPDTSADVVASDAVSPTRATQESERRSLAEVLIENARLVAQVEGKDAIITELKENSSFLREEVREARRTRDDVKNIAERMLDTLKTMAIGRLTAAPPHDEPLRATFVDREVDNRQ